MKRLKDDVINPVVMSLQHLLSIQQRNETGMFCSLECDANIAMLTKILFMAEILSCQRGKSTGGINDGCIPFSRARYRSLLASLSGTLNGTVPSLTLVVAPVLLHDKTRPVLFS